MKNLFLTSLLLIFTTCAYSQETTEIKLSGPAAVISYPLMVMAQQQSLTKQNIALSFTRWKNPDQLRALILGQQVDFSAMPSNLAAIIFNKGHPLKLLNISIWDIMTIVSRDRNLTNLADLRHQEIVVPFKNDMPTILLNKLLQQQLKNKAETVEQRISHNLLDSSQLLLAGQVDHALLIEPVTSMVIFKNQQKKGKPLYRALNISALWQQTFPESPRLPQAGIIANNTVVKNTPLMHTINNEYIAKAHWCKSQPKQCANIVKLYLPKAPLPALVDAIKHTKLLPETASKVKNSITQFYQILLDTNPKLIGGELPAAEFYL